MKKPLQNRPEKSHKAKIQKSPVRCLKCNRMFSCEATLKEHMVKHTGKFKFWCGQCQRVFQYRREYQNHMDRHEGITFPCQTCPKRYKSKASLKYHESEHTGVYLHRCSICNKGFNDKYKCTKHEASCPPLTWE